MAKPTLCPACGYFSDCHSAIGDGQATPKAGDVSLCISCGSLNIYGTDLSLSVAPTEVWQELDDAAVCKIGIAQKHILERGPIVRQRRVN